MISKHDGGLFRFIRWRPGVRGARRSLQLRTMTRDGRFWFVALDVQAALGWTKRELLRRRSERLDGGTWGTTTSQWEGRGPRLAFISLTALQVVMVGSVTQYNRSFLRWLESLDGVITPGGAGDFAVDQPTIAQFSSGAEQLTEVHNSSEPAEIRNETSSEPLRLAA